MVACCRCNRTGRCGNCACVKAGSRCHDCLPSRLERCYNTSVGQPTATTSLANPDSTAYSVYPARTIASAEASAVASTVATAVSLVPAFGEGASPPATVILSLGRESATDNTAAILTNQPPATLLSEATQDNLNFTWGLTDAVSFTRQISEVYNEVVQWKRNIFKIPHGNTGKAFVSQLALLYNAFGTASALEPVALQATIVMPHLLLQKPHKGSKNKVHLECLKTRLELWKDGKIEELLKEGRAIQSRFPRTPHKHLDENVARSFSNLMFEGKITQALQLLSDKGRGNVLELNQTFNINGSSTTVRDILRSKHPPSYDASPETLLQGTLPDIHPVIFDEVNASLIRSTSLHLSGAAGPSGLDSHAWRRLCTAFKSSSVDLCQSLALVAKRLCTTAVPPESVSPLLACRLVALDKCPGVRPIGIGDTARRLITKAVLSVIKDDIMDVAGTTPRCCTWYPGVHR